MALIFNSPTFSDDKWHVNCAETTQVSAQLTKITNNYIITIDSLEQDASIQDVEAAATDIINKK